MADAANGGTAKGGACGVGEGRETVPRPVRFKGREREGKGAFKERFWCAILVPACAEDESLR